MDWNDPKNVVIALLAFLLVLGTILVLTQDSDSDEQQHPQSCLTHPQSEEC